MPGSVENTSSTAASSSTTTANTQEPVSITRALEILAELGSSVEGSPSYQELGTLLHERRFKLKGLCSDDGSAAKLALVFAAFVDKPDSLPTPGLRFLAKVSRQVSAEAFSSLFSAAITNVPSSIFKEITGFQLDICGTFLETFSIEELIRDYGTIFASELMHRLLRFPTDQNKKAARILLQNKGMLENGLKYIDSNTMREGRPGDSDECLLALIEICLECDKEGFFQFLEERHDSELGGFDYGRCFIYHATNSGKLQSLRAICEALLEDEPELLKKVLIATNSPLLYAVREDNGRILSYLLGIAVQLKVIHKIRDWGNRNLLWVPTKVEGGSAFRTLRQELSRETLVQMASERHEGLTLFAERARYSHNAVHKNSWPRYPSAEQMSFLYSLLNTEQQKEAVEWLIKEGIDGFCEMAEYGEPSFFEFLYGLMADRLQMTTLFCSRSRDERIMHHAAKNPHGAPLLLNLLREQDEKFVAQALAPGLHGNTPFHVAAVQGPPDTILALAEIAHAVGGSTAASCCAQTDGTANLLSAAIEKNSPESVRATILALRTYFPNELEKMMAATEGRKSPLEVAVGRGMPEILDAVTELYLTSPPDLIANVFIHEGRGSCLMETLTSPLPHASLAAKLLERLRDEQVEAALTVKGLHKLMDSPDFFNLLMQRFPDASRRLSILMRARRVDHTCRFMPCAKMEAFLGSASSQPYALLLFHSNNDYEIWDMYPQLKNAFEAKLAPMQAELNAGVDDHHLRNTVKHHLMLMQAMFQALALAEYSQEEVAQLIPYLDRIQHLHSIDHREVLSDVIRRLIPGRELLKPSDDYQAPAKKQLILHRVVIGDIKLRGLDAGLLEQLEGYIEAQGSKLSPTSDSGREILRLLLTLHSLTGTIWQRVGEWGAGFNTLLARIVSGNPLAELRAVEQLLFCAPEQLSKKELSTHNDSLADVAHRYLRQLLPVDDMEDFDERYQAFTSSIREPNSLISYAARVAKYPGVQKDLGTCMRQVLLGTFQKARYLADGNTHLQELYQANVELQVLLPTLCKDMGRHTVGGAEKKKANFDHVRALLRDKVVEDKLIDETTFPHIHAYLQLLTEAGKVTDPDALKAVSAACGKAQGARARALRQEEKEEKAAGTRKKGDPAKHLSDKDYLRGELQSQLMSVCTRPTAKEVLGNLSTAIDIAKKVEAELANFIQELEALRNTLLTAAGSTVDNYEVSLTDDFWDLMRCGSDVGGSCQSLTSPYDMQRCLLGYVMNGFVFPIVVKKPDSAYIEARRLLFINVDEDDRPALFLERPYSNNSHPAIDEAMVRMAKEVANHLDIPLYSKSVEGTGETATLRVKKGAAARMYSDAGGGEHLSAFDIRYARLVHQPSSAASSSTASSSDAASSTDAPARHGGCQIC